MEFQGGFENSRRWKEKILENSRGCWKFWLNSRGYSFWKWISTKRGMDFFWKNPMLLWTTMNLMIKIKDRSFMFHKNHDIFLIIICNLFLHRSHQRAINHWWPINMMMVYNITRWTLHHHISHHYNPKLRHCFRKVFFVWKLGINSIWLSNVKVFFWVEKLTEAIVSESISFILCKSILYFFFSL